MTPQALFLHMYWTSGLFAYWVQVLGSLAIVRVSASVPQALLVVFNSSARRQSAMMPCSKLFIMSVALECIATAPARPGPFLAFPALLLFYAESRLCSAARA